MTNSPQWREGFIKEFEHTDETNFIMDFIETQIAQARREEREEMKKKCLEVIPEASHIEESIWNNFRLKTIDSISSL